MKEQKWTYIARHPQTALIEAVTCDDGTPRVAEDVAEFMKTGHKIERVPVEWARKFLFTTEQFSAVPDSNT